MIEFPSFTLKRDDFFFKIAYPAVGALLARAVCHIPCVHAIVWGITAASISYFAIQRFSNTFEPMLDPYLPENANFRNFIFMSIISISTAGLNYLSRKALSYLMNVPSNLFVILAAPLVTLGYLLTRCASFPTENCT